MILKRTFAFIFVLAALLIGAASLNPLFADSKSDFIFKDEGLECRIPLIQPWRKMTAFFGFSTLLYQQTENDDRVTFGLVITPFEGDSFKEDNIQKEIEVFHQGKKEFVEELGGRYIAAALSLFGKDAHQTIRAAVDYELDGIEYRDSTYFRFVNDRLVHAKVIFPLKKFNEKVVEEQTTQLLAGMSCSPAK